MRTIINYVKQLFRRQPSTITKVCDSCGGRHLFLTADDVPDHPGYLGTANDYHWFNCKCNTTLVIPTQQASNI